MKTKALLTGLLLILLSPVFNSCSFLETDGMDITGKVIDADSKEGIPDLRIIVDGVTQFGFGSRTEVGASYTNSNGEFKVFIETIEHPTFYEFFVNTGSSEVYTEESDYYGERYLDSLSGYNIPLIFELSKIEPLRINLKNINPYDEEDIVSIYFLSDTMGFLRVKSIEDFGTNSSALGSHLVWEGSNVNSTIHGNILVNEELTIVVDIVKNNIESEMIRIVIGQRNTVNEIDIAY